MPFMGYRLTKIYTKTGDRGQTGLGDGSRTDKNSPRIVAIGTVDELNATVGVLLCHVNHSTEITSLLLSIQNDLFDIGGELSLPQQALLSESYVRRLEQAIDQFNAPLPPLANFILPGGSLSSAHCHVARTVCRRAERTVISLQQQDPINPYTIHYLNRLSDLLFVLARVLLVLEGRHEILWQQPTTAPRKSS
jgi:cob(I)alamin adenosyltransferase